MNIVTNLAPEKIIDALEAAGYTVVPGENAVLFVDDEEDDMANLTPDQTGVDNTVWVSPRGRARHVARIKIAIDPPDALTTDGKSISMAIHDCSTLGDAPSHIVKQAERFIERNRAALLDYWDGRIFTEELFKRLQKP